MHGVHEVQFFQDMINIPNNNYTNSRSTTLVNIVLMLHVDLVYRHIYPGAQDFVVLERCDEAPTAPSVIKTSQLVVDER